MSDAQWLQQGDMCQLNPVNCEDGLSFSIWEKMEYGENPLLDYQYGNEFKPKKYIASTGADYFPDTGMAYPGFTLYRQGTDLVAIVSTGEKVWRATAPAQVYNGTWANLAIRWRPVNESDPLAEKNPLRLGGLELYINHDKVAQTVLSEFTNAGLTTYTPVTDYKINGKDPAVMMVGCGWDYQQGKFDFHNENEIDELALWSRALVTNETVDETIFFLGGFSKIILFC